MAERTDPATDAPRTPSPFAGTVAEAARHTTLAERLNLWIDACRRTPSPPPPIGTSPYAPPESTGLVDEADAERSTVYVLGMLGHACLAGRHPWDGMSGDALRHAIVSRSLPPIIDGTVSAVTLGRLNRLIARATDKNPANRMATPAELVAELRTVAGMLTHHDGSPESHLAIHGTEFRALAAWVRAVRTDGTGIVEITGPSGIGKTFLWETAVDALAAADERWFYVKARQGERRPYDVVTQVLESVPQMVQSVLREHSGFEPLVPFLRTIAPALDTVLPAIGSVPDPTRLEPTRALSHLLARLGSATGLTVFCFDDSQWIDPYSRAVIHALMGSYAGVAVALLSRQPTSDVTTISASVSPVHLRRLALTPLAPPETVSFVRSLGYGPERLGPEEVARLGEVGAGNPMAIMALLRTDQPVSRVVSADVLVAVAAERIRRLTPTTRRVIMVSALVGTPLEPRTLVRFAVFPAAQVSRGFDEAIAAGVIAEQRGSGAVRFAHDSFETAARDAALGDPTVRRAALQVLVADARAGGERAAYAAVELLGSAGADEVEPADRDWVLINAARRFLDRLALEDALSIVADNEAVVADESRLPLYRIGHEAAYLLGDAARMSRYYRRIVKWGTAHDRAEARYLWVRRGYADLRFVGATQTGVRILAGLAVTDPAMDWWDGADAAAAYLDRRRPAAMLRRIRRRGRSDDPSVRLATDTLARMLLPSVTADRTRLPVLAYYALRIAMDHGWSRSTGIGFVAWAAYCGLNRPVANWIRPYFECALALARSSGDAVAIHSVAMLVVGLGSHWWVPYRDFSHRLEMLHREGRALGNWEYAAHAGHLHAQSLLYSGVPLPEVHEAFRTVRQEAASYGLDRIDHALAKHHQAVETLMGQGGDPARLDGRIITETAYLERTRAAGDKLSLAGFSIVKTVVAFFADRPDLIVDQYRRSGKTLAPAVFFHDQLIMIFCIGVAAYRTGDAALGAAMARRLRRLARDVPATHRHRRDIVRGERAAYYGRPAVARFRLRRGYTRALAMNAVHEAAYAAERLGDVTGARRWWYQAESLYRHWGGVHAAARVREKLGLPEDPASTVARPVVRDALSRALAGAGTEARFAAVLADHLEQVTSAVEISVQILCRNPDRRFRTTVATTPDGLVVADDSAPDRWLLLDELAAGESHAVPAGAGAGHREPAIVARSVPIAGVDVGVVLTGAPGAAAFAESVVRRVVTALATAAPYAVAVAFGAAMRASHTALDRTRQQLSQTEQYRRQLFSTITDAFLLIDAGLSVVFSNPAAAPYLVRGSGTLPVLHPDLRGPVGAMLAGGDGGSGTEPRRVTCCNAVVSLRVTRVGDASELVAVSIYDITESEEREQQIARQERQLIVSDRLASIGMFSSAIVHEISNPNHILQLNTQSLAVVLSWLESADLDGRDSSAVAQARELVGQIEDATQRIEAVLQLVKSYGREGRTDRWEAVDAGAVCSRAARFSRIMVSQYTDHFSLEVAPDLPSIEGDPALLEQAVVNLIKNACEALSGREGRVRVAVTAGDGVVEIAISDTGRGFPEALRARLGEPFLSGRREDGGTGLGLAIVASIVEKHRGTISVDRDEVFSTRVRITLPVPPPVDR